MSKYDATAEAIAEFSSLNPIAHFGAAYIESVVRILRNDWLPFLQSRNVRRDQVAYVDWTAFERKLAERKKSDTRVRNVRVLVMSYYRFLGRQMQHAGYLKMVDDMEKYGAVKSRTQSIPWDAYPLEDVPRILAAALSYTKGTPSPEIAKLHRQFSEWKSRGGFSVSATDEYKEDWLLVTLGIYVSPRSGTAYGLKVSDFDLDAGTLKMHVKGGYLVTVPIHARVVEAVREHIATRPYKSDFLFRYGRDPWVAVAGSGTWHESARARNANVQSVSYAMKRVSSAYAVLNGTAALKKLSQSDAAGTKYKLTYHRFRDTIGRYAEQFGLTESEVRLLLTHGARTITQHYSRADIDRVRSKWNKVDLGNFQWVMEHKDSGIEVTALSNGGANGGDVSKIAEQMSKLTARLDALLDENKALRDEIAKLRGGQ